MWCPQCQSQNGTSANFCQECGTRLSGASPLDGPLAQAARPLSDEVDWPSSPLAPGQIRLATVMFADMRGSVETTRSLDAEDAARIVGQLVKVMVDGVREHGGRVERFLGDGILAVFGIPVAQERDAHRAILAARTLQRGAQKLDLGLRIGINTGEVYFGAVGSETHPIVTVMGPVVNLAARLEEVAEPGSILVGEPTFHLTQEEFQYSRRELQLKGYFEPVVAFELGGPLPYPGESPFRAPFSVETVGRDAEMRSLRRALDEAVSGSRQAVLLTGEAGMGKTRLLRDLRRSILDNQGPPGDPRAHRRDARPSLLWLEGHCLEFKRETPYWPFLDLLGGLVGRSGNPESADPNRPADRGLTHLLRTLVARGSLTPARSDEIDRLLNELIFPSQKGDSPRSNLPPDLLHRLTFAAVRDFLQALAAQSPLILAVEDLHWADDLSLELLSYLVAELASAPVLVLLTARPDPPDSPSDVGSLSSRFGSELSHLNLRELGPDETRRMLHALLDDSELPSPVYTAILEKTGGNPFFLQEAVRSLIETGALYRSDGRWLARPEVLHDIAPDSIRRLLSIRVDCLPPEAKQVLQAAAVIGRMFGRRLLSRLVGLIGLESRLNLLIQHGLVIQGSTATRGEYSFAHALIQQVVYRGLLRTQRREIHLAAAQSIEELYPDRPEEFCEELAYHFTHAGSLVEAVPYTLRAAQKAHRMYANETARTYYRRVLDLLSQADVPDPAPIEIEAREGLAEVLFAGGSHREAEVEIRRAMERLDLTQCPRRYASLAARLADAVHWQGRTEDAIEIARQGLAAVRDEPHCIEAISLLEVITRSFWAKDDIPEAHRYSLRLQAAIEQAPYADSLYMAYYAIAWVELRRGEYGSARDWLRRMEARFLEHQNENGLARCYHGLGDVARAEGQYDESRQWLEKSLAFCEKTGDAHHLMEGHLEMAQTIILMDGDPSQINHHLDRGLALAREMMDAGQIGETGVYCEILTEAYLRHARLAEARSLMERAMDLGVPQDSYLEGLRRRCAASSSLPAFDQFSQLLPQSYGEGDLPA